MLTPAQRADLATWPADDREEVAERAAIMQFDGARTREDAEREAYLCVKARREREAGR